MNYFKYILENTSFKNQKLELFWVIAWLIMLGVSVRELVRTENNSIWIAIALCIYVQVHKYRIFKKKYPSK